MEQEILNQAPAGLQVTESARLDLLSAAKWAKFLCIVGCVCVCLMLLFGILMMVFGAALTQYMGDSPLGGAMGLLYVIFAALYIYPLIKGFQFANGAKAACLTGDSAQLARSFAGLRSLLVFCGILTIIILVIYAFMLIIGVGAFAALAAA
jgi:hypothetical protein